MTTTARFTWGDELPPLEGRRTALRPLADGDAPALLAIFGSPEVMRYWSSPPLRDLAAAHDLVSEIQTGFAQRRLFQWGILADAEGPVIGTCTLFNLDPMHRRAELGYALRHDLWGQGLAMDAVSTLIEFAFGPLELHRLEADADPNNERSLRLLERLGFRREGYLRERWHHLGNIHDAVFLGLLRSEFSVR